MWYFDTKLQLAYKLAVYTYELVVYMYELVV